MNKIDFANEFLRYSSRYGETLGYLRNMGDTFCFIEAMKDGYSGFPITENSFFYGRCGVSIADRFRYVEMDESLGEKESKVESLIDRLDCEQKSSFHPYFKEGLVKDDVVRPLVFVGVGYLIGSIGRNFF